MKRHSIIRAILFAAFVITVSLLLFACGGKGEDKHKVVLWLTDAEGVTVVGDNPVYVEDGGTATFEVRSI